MLSPIVRSGARPLIGGCLALLLAAAATAVPTTAQAPPTIRIATVAIDAGAEPYFAQVEGFFKAAGLNVEITALSNGAAVAAAVAGGSADIGQSNVVSIAQAHERGLPFVFVAPANSYVSAAHQAALLVAADSSIRSAHDLNGKTMAVSGLKNITQVGTQNWIDKNGGDAASVKFIEMPFPTMPDALEAGRIAGAVMTSPELDQALGSGKVRVLAYPYDDIAKEFVIGGFFSTSDWAKAHPDLVHAFARVMAQTARWANTHQSDSAKILQDQLGVKVPPGAHRVPFGETIDRAGVQKLIDVSAKYGALKTAFPAADIIAS